MPQIKNVLLQNSSKIHTTELGVLRIKKNLMLDVDDVVETIRQMVESPSAVIYRKGKNWYVEINACRITINASNYVIITAHKIKERKENI